MTEKEIRGRESRDRKRERKREEKRVKRGGENRNNQKGGTERRHRGQLWAGEVRGRGEESSVTEGDET